MVASSQEFLLLVLYSFLATYIALMSIYGVGLAIYHFCFFLPELNRDNFQAPQEEEIDTDKKLRKIADKHNPIEKTQEDSSIVDSVVEKTQTQEDTKTVSPNPKGYGSRLKRKSSANLTAISDTPGLVSRAEREQLIQKTQED